MLELARHIEILLLDTDCVILPDFGGFVAYNTSAKWDNEESIFLPPARIIGFNPYLKMNDGLLVQSYMKVYDTDFADASKILDKQISDLIRKLHEDGKVELENIGELQYSTSESYSFIPYDNKVASPFLFGLDAFEIQELSSLAEKPIAKNTSPSLASFPKKAVAKKLRTISGRWQNVAGIAAVSIVAVFLFLISTPVENTYVPTGNYAQIFPSEIVEQLDKNSLLTTYVEVGNKKSEINDSVLPGENVSTENAVANTVESMKETATSGTEKVEETELTPAKEETAAVATEPAATHLETAVANTENSVADVKLSIAKAKQVRPYNLIIASIASKNQAQSKLKEIKAKGFTDAKIITGNGKFRVSVMSLSTRQEANEQLIKLRRNPEFENAWLLAK